MRDLSTVLPVVMAGGEGRRLRPLTAVIPKPLVPVGGLSILERILISLADQGFSRVVISTGYMAPLVRGVAQELSVAGLELYFAHETTPLGTAGVLLSPLLRTCGAGDFDHVLAINGDTLSDLDFGRFCEGFSGGRESVRVATSEITSVSEFGEITVAEFEVSDYLKYTRDLRVPELKRLLSVVEKPVRSCTVSMGVNLFSRTFLDQLEKRPPIGVPDLISAALESGQIVTTFQHTGYWYDLGRFSDLALVDEMFASHL